jgi:hypothetical protein
MAIDPDPIAEVVLPALEELPDLLYSRLFRPDLAAVPIAR